MTQERGLSRIFSITIISLLVSVLWLGIFIVVPDEVAANVTHSGSTSGNEVWAAADNWHRVQGDFTVSSGDTVVIEDGVNIYFYEDSNIIVNGKLFANGFSHKIVKKTHRRGKTRFLMAYTPSDLVHFFRHPFKFE